MPEPLPQDLHDRQLLKAAPASSDDWDDATWAAWWRTADRVHARPTYDELAAEVAQLRTLLAIRDRQLADLDERCATAEHSTDHDYDEAAVPR